MLMINQTTSPQIYSPNPIVETINTIGNANCNGTYLNPDDYFVFYYVKNKITKEEILQLFGNEISFDKDDEIAAEKEIKRLSVEKKGNFYDYYA